MEQNLFLTPEEQIIAEKFLNKFEKKAQNFKRTRWILLFILILLLIEGLHINLDYYSEITSNYSWIEELKNSPIPEEPIQKYWFVGELRRTARIYELLYKKSMIDNLDCIIGIMCLLIFLFGSVYLYSHWNDHIKFKIIAKIMRSKWEEFKASQGKLP